MSRPPIDRRHSRIRRIGRLGLVLGGGGLIGLAAPAVVAAHQLTGRFTSPIPLGAYLVGAAAAVGVSFALVFARPDAPAPDHTSAARAGSTTGAPAVRRTLRVPPLVRRAIAAIGLLAWVWIVVQGVILGSHSESDVASLFLWTYGWVGLALVSAFIGPVWTWLDPFSSLHRLTAGAVARMGLSGGDPASYPIGLGRWPAILTFAIIVWLELAVPAARSGRGLGLILVGYTVVTLVAMAQFGRDAWRGQGEVFSVWFGLVGRLAPLALPHDGAADGAVGDRLVEADRLEVRSFGYGLIRTDREPADLVLVALSIGGILYDGLSQTQRFFDLFGVPTIVEQSLLLFGWLGLVVGIALLVARTVGFSALTAGLVPIAIGYLIAHYLTFILFDSQRIVLALTDPLGLGSDLLGLGEFEPGTTWLPGAVAWSIQLVAVVGGHVIGAWAGHAVYVRERTSGHGPAAAGSRRDPRLREIPLAVLMVGLTSLTLWSLGQAVVTESAAPAALSRAPAGPSAPSAPSATALVSR